MANYLQSLTAPTSPVSPPPAQPSQLYQNLASEQLTSELMASVHEVMQRAEAEGRDPDQDLRQVVSRAVLQGVVTGFQMSTDTDNDDPSEAHPAPAINGTPAKRSRTDDSS